MTSPVPKVIVIESLTEYSAKDATEIGELMPYLSKKFDGSPISKELLTEIINSPSHEQLVARDESDKIVGTATLTIVIGAAIGKIAYLHDLVVDSKIQGAGIGSEIWKAIIDWCKNNNIDKLEFTSNPKKEGAHRFYLKHGAEIYETSFFRKIIDDNHPQP